MAHLNNITRIMSSLRLMPPKFNQALFPQSFIGSSNNVKSEKYPASLVQHRNLRTVPSKANISKMETKLSDEQSVMADESKLKTETITKINNKISSDPGRLFAIIYLRGCQHKITTGKLQTLSH